MNYSSIIRRTLARLRMLSRIAPNAAATPATARIAPTTANEVLDSDMPGQPRRVRFIPKAVAA